MPKQKERKVLKDKDLSKVVNDVIDVRTYELLERISSRLRIEQISGPISSGKESKIFYGRGKEEYAMKVYHITTATHKRAIRRYLVTDKRIGSMNSSTFQLIQIWARREYSNAATLYEDGINVPKPYLLERNVLVMKFLGYNGNRAPLLKEYDYIDDKLYKMIIEQIKRMTTISKLVHGDLSEYNIMIYDDKPFFIDFTQSVPIDSENALELLRRDLININRFFSSKGIQVIDLNELILSISK
ncbi:serine/threonine protein kinase [Sulfolobales archaeon HS-7]|nr:serine/threonine protein kinase [Sulfolobales archaeon HS-7]